MRVKLFHAIDEPAAIAQIRREMGGDAVILSTRRVRDGVEIAAALEDENSAPAHPAPDVGAALRWHGANDCFCDHLSRDSLETALRANLRFRPTITDDLSQPLILIGPPGSGKTLTIARLATRLVMGGVKPLVITADTKKAGGTEQLAAFTRVLGIPLMVAGRPELVRRCLARREAKQPVLIDTAGLDVFSSADRGLAMEFTSAAGAMAALVLPSGLDTQEAGDVAAAFASAGADRLIPTRLDLARRLGSVLTAAHAGLALSDAGVGPGAADGLRPLTPTDLAHRLMQAYANRPTSDMRLP